MSSPIIKIENLGKIFKDGTNHLNAVKNISLEVHYGDYIAILGRSGSGKSTLLSMLGLLDTASSGSYFLSGHDVSSLSFYQKSILRNKHLGWIFQNFNLINDMTVLENITLPLKYNSEIKARNYHELGMQALRKVMLEDKADSYPNQLSGGQQQRIAIARAIVMSPDIILADEPTGNLDKESGQAIVKLLNEINKSGTTVLLVTHDLDIARQCKQSITIDGGCISSSTNLSIVA